MHLPYGRVSILAKLWPTGDGQLRVYVDQVADKRSP